jgi:uncharacterized membrane protein
VGLVDVLYIITGGYLFAFSYASFRDGKNPKRLGTSIFWGVLGVLFVFGETLPESFAGILVILLAVIPGFNLMGRGSYDEVTIDQRRSSADRFGYRLFIPVLIIPAGTILIASFTPWGALAGLGLSALIALSIALPLTGESPRRAVHEGRRTMDSLGWTAVISQFLATIGLLFNSAGVGETIAGLVSGFLLDASRISAIAMYCGGMMFFSFVLGNAFAAFAIVTTGIGLPFLVELHGSDPAVISVLAMLSGYSGSIISPLAGNFILVPTILLKIQDRWGIAKVELPIVIAMLLVHMAVMYFCS